MLGWLKKKLFSVTDAPTGGKPKSKNVKKVCLLPTCKTKHVHRNDYCSADCCRAHTKLRRAA